MAIILEMLTDTGKSISELKAAIPEFHIVKEKIKVSSDASLKILRAVRQHYKHETLNLLDGIHIDFGDSWIHARRSNTEPVIRIMAEAKTREKAEQLAQELMAIVTSDEFKT
jgi:phosphomannomutase